MGVLKACVLFLRAMLVPKARLAIENLALRQQLAVCKQGVKRPRLRPRDRVFWASVRLLVGVFCWLFFRSFAKANPVPSGDPLLSESLRYHC